MESDLNKAIEILRDATAALGEKYFQLPVVGQEDPIYRERVYCYELYHLMRKIWPNDWPYSLCGEVDKSGHPIICNISALKKSKPDFIFHVPYSMGQNLIVVEVKPISASKKNIHRDLKKLTAFVKQARYFHACYLFYGNEKLPGNGNKKTPDSIKSICKKLDKRSNKASIDLSRISLFIHESVGKRAKKIDW